MNAKFDEVYRNGGIYNFLSHPQWVDYGPEGFYEQHVRYLGGRADIWYVPMGPLYAYQRVAARTRVRRLASDRFEATHDLPDFPVSVTLEFTAPGAWDVEVSGQQPTTRRQGDSLFITLRPPATVTFHRGNP